MKPSATAKPSSIVKLGSACVLTLLSFACDGSSTRFLGPMSPTPVPSTVLPTPSPIPTPSPTPQSIEVGEIVQFRIEATDWICSGAGRCHSYYITPPADGQLEVELTPVSHEMAFLSTTDLYLVPGADWWNTGPGARMSVTANVTKGFTHEIRMFSSLLPSTLFELRTTLR